MAKASRPELAAGHNAPSRPLLTSAQSRFERLGAAGACGGLLILFAVLSWMGVRNESATYDEPGHATAAYAMQFLHDYRVNPESPPLWLHYIALSMRPDSLHVDVNKDSWRGQLASHYVVWDWVVDVLYRTPGTDFVGFIARARALSLVLGVALGLLIARWSWQLAGGAGAIAAVAAFALDPNFLAHAALVKSDIAVTLMYAGATRAAWLAGRRLTWVRVASVSAFCAGAVCVKFSGILIVPVFFLLLAMRAMLPDAWPMPRRVLATRRSRTIAAAALFGGAMAIVYVGLWASYGFRFSATPDASVRLDHHAVLDRLKARDLEAQGTAVANGARESADWVPPPSMRFLMLLERHHLLPQACVAGLIYTQFTVGGSASYLLGERSMSGWWYYFPLAVAFKTPIATLIAMLLAVVTLLIWRRPLETANDTTKSVDALPRFWTPLCLIVPPTLYGAVAMAGHMDIGLRHIFPVYPYLFILIGTGAARVWRHFPRIGRPAMLALGVALAIESGLTFPHYLPFFNVVCGGPAGAIDLLGDSNFDWGQDLPLLADWQRRHPSDKLYLCYFGLADPAAYGIRYTNLPGGYDYGPPPQPVTEPGVIAISVTNLQGIYLSPQEKAQFEILRKIEPEEVLGETIYLYRVGQVSAVGGK